MTSNLRAIGGRLAKDESGSNALEYGLIVGLISLAIVTGATAAGGALGTLFSDLSTKINSIATTISATT
jgi:pilus assembly protein Flp/PilA